MNTKFFNLNFLVNNNIYFKNKLLLNNKVLAKF